MPDIKIQVRKGMFETNSSSMHSLSISDKDSVMDTIPLEKDKLTVVIDCDYDFQWGQEKYNDPEAKAAYCILDGVDVKYVEDAIKAQTGAIVIKYVNENKGSIDHQSRGEASNTIQSVEDARNFIFNPNSILDIDNDNH